MADLIMEAEMASQNHGLAQFRLGVQLAALGEAYEGATELSLDMSTPDRQAILEKHGLGETRELKPDLVLYKAEDFQFIDCLSDDDKLRVIELPLLCVEIISPTQTTREILAKFRVYFEIGVKSCWYVDPSLKIALVYNKALESEVYRRELVDNTLGIKISLSKVFY